MLNNKRLEFEIVNGEVLNISDFSWLINSIDFVYIDRSCISQKREYAIFINSGHEVVELYYRTSDFDDIYDEFERLGESIKKANQTFNRLPGNPTYIDYSKVREIRLSKITKDNLIVGFYDQEDVLVSPILRKNAKENYSAALKLLNDAQQNKDLVQ